MLSSESNHVLEIFLTVPFPICIADVEDQGVRDSDQPDVKNVPSKQPPKRIEGLN